LVLLLKDAREIVLEFLPPHITGSRYRDAVAVPCGCVLLDVVFHVIVVNVVWTGQRERGAIGREREMLTMRPCRDRMLAKSRAILHVDDDVAMSE
jgi:hypothetical protein